ncbi:hypothetical protein BROSI_A3013 [Candidatus Brocadia sinica JPN1]|uniref:Uncharacterized protein n=1 Tax=Candidatus Brocadia sinica JPN1 TaxID=1197129 RepID=A0ABQ0K0L1_9BACT|nr:hypothetical protein BROSI_A3013 [Candidatus Brocadia sinica JPN1]GIK11505.1 MAG: hypothetical protein BroJett002_02120 [Candidatus Brocadia sinica]GJQ18081.1 MAG: hypothetical protein HBSIN01_20400 [Candidatus Brocadia sinica]
MPIEADGEQGEIFATLHCRITKELLQILDFESGIEKSFGIAINSENLQKRSFYNVIR